MGLGHARLPIPPTGYGAPRLNRTIAHCLQDSRSSTKLAVLKNLEHIDGNRTIVSRLPSANSAIELNVHLEPDFGIPPKYPLYESGVMLLYESDLKGISSSRKFC